MPAHLAHLLRVRSQRTEAVLAYLHAVQEWPDRHKPVYLPGKLTDVYVPLDIVIQEKEAKWMEEYPRLPRTVILWGAPGAGKTLALRMTARELARQKHEALLNFHRTAEEMLLPVYVRLSDVADWTREAISPADALKAVVRNGINSLLEDRRLQRQMEEVIEQDPDLYLVRTHWFLDALDEVPQPARLQSFFERLSGQQCRVTLTARRNATVTEVLRWLNTEKQWADCRIEPFSPHQRQTFIARWLSAKTPVASGVINFDLGSNPRFAGWISNPLLLSLACKVAERHPLGPDTTRGELYEQILLDLISGASKSEKPPLRPAILLKLLTHIAFLRFHASPVENEFTEEAWINDSARAIQGHPITHKSKFTNQINIVYDRNYA